MADNWTDRLSDYIDGELSDTDTRQLESHLERCDECREILAQLETVTARARDLPDRTPDQDLWAGICSRIKQPGHADADVVGIARSGRSSRRVSFTLPQLLAASIALMAVSAASVWFTLSGPGDNAIPPVAVSEALGETAIVMASFDDPEVDAVIADLERVLEEGRDRLDPETVAVLEQSLTVIDQALAEARAALMSDPTNHYLTEHLSATLNQKVRLLRRAAILAGSASG